MQNPEGNVSEELAISPGKGPFSPEEKVELARAINAHVSCNELARRTGRSSSTISRFARDNGLTFDRATQTLPAREAQSSDLATRRLNLAAQLVAPIQKLIADLNQPQTVRKVNSRTGETITYRAMPDATAKRNIAAAISFLFTPLNAALASPLNSGEGRGAIIEMLTVIRSQAASENTEIIEGSSD
jgi:hypothetical protein